MGITLSLLDRLDIHHGDAGLTEPSGLCLTADGKGLWVVSDDTSALFQLMLNGPRGEYVKIPIAANGLEGICISSDEQDLFFVSEEGNRLIQFSLIAQQIVSDRLLSEMKGYNKISEIMLSKNANKGLEGITADSHNNALFLLKEGEPGALIRVDANLKSITAVRKLNKKRGFTDDNIRSKKIDYSGIAYDIKRRALWIVSDRAQRLYLYDWEADQVRFDISLSYKCKGKVKEIIKAEGVAHDPVTDRLYIVSDAEAQLYVYQIN